MRVVLNSTPSFCYGAVRKDYYNRAAQEAKTNGHSNFSWMSEIIEESLIFNTMLVQDARDTVSASRKFVPKNSLEAYDNFFRELYV